MSFFIIVFVIFAWISLLLYCARALAFSLRLRARVRTIAIAAIVGAGFILPIWDEIKGVQEFEALCAIGGVYKIVPGTEGKRFNFIYDSTPNQKLSGYSRPVEEMTITYTDTATGNILVTGKAYVAHGGWLVRTIGFSRSSTNGPLIGRNQCFPGDASDQAYRLHAITEKIVN